MSTSLSARPTSGTVIPPLVDVVNSQSTCYLRAGLFNQSRSFVVSGANPVSSFELDADPWFAYVDMPPYWLRSNFVTSVHD